MAYPEGGADAVDAPPFVVSQHIRQALAAGLSRRVVSLVQALLTGLIEGAATLRMSNPQDVGHSKVARRCTARCMERASIAR